MLYGTTPEFLERLGIGSLADLPPIAPLLADARWRTPTPRDRGRTESGRPLRGGTPRPPDPEPDAQERLQKTLARVGFGSRRSAEDLIRSGRVTIGGHVATLGDRIDPSRDQVAVDGIPIPVNPEVRYFVLNKPAGVTTTMKDVHAAKTLGPYLPPGPRVFAVGRLDRESEGVLLLTNDGELAHRIQHPSYRVEKEYLVEVEGRLPPRPFGVSRRVSTWTTASHALSV